MSIWPSNSYRQLNKKRPYCSITLGDSCYSGRGQGSAFPLPLTTHDPCLVCHGSPSRVSQIAFYPPPITNNTRCLIIVRDDYLDTDPCNLFLSEWRQFRSGHLKTWDTVYCSIDLALNGERHYARSTDLKTHNSTLNLNIRLHYFHEFFASLPLNFKFQILISMKERLYHAPELHTGATTIFVIDTSTPGGDVQGNDQ